MSYRLVPQPPRYTVDDLTADRSLLVRITFDFILTTTKNVCLQDITDHVTRDPQHPLPIGAGVGGDVYRGIYTWLDRDNGIQHSLNVRTY